MRLKRFKTIATVLLVCLGGGLLVVSLFATQLGLDSSENMGTMRQQLAVVSTILLLLPLLGFMIGRLERRFHRGKNLLDALQKWSDGMDQKSGKSRSTGRKKRIIVPAFVWAILGVVVVMLGSLWYMSGGKMSQLTPYSHFYDMQADGFLAGQTSLLEEPPAQLAQIEDPYNWKEREGFTYLWDATYYDGKYFIYWGPVPALLACGIKLVHPMVVEDQLLVLIFISGLAAVFAALLAELRKRWFPSAPGWTLFLFTAILGFSTPVFWLVNRPSVYEAAIASCQFFLMLGIYAVVKGLISGRRQWAWLLLAGFALGAATGSRMSVLFVVLLVFGVTAWQLIKNDRKAFLSLCALTVPLAVFAVGLAWFNYARFGSIFETGLRYQLTGNFMGGEDTLLYSPWYAAPNFILALFQAFKVTAHFPFFKAVSNPHWGGMIRIAQHNYNVEPSSGILYTLPVLYLMVIPAVRVIKRFWQWLNEKPAAEPDHAAPQFPRWLWSILIGGPAVAFTAMVCFMMMTMRYLADFVPMLLLLTAVLVLYEIERHKASAWRKNSIVVLLLVLGIASIGIGLLINFANTDMRFMNINPGLFEQISGWFG